MSYVVLTEEQAAGSEYVRGAMNRLKAALDSNLAVLKSGERAVTAETVYLGAQQSLPQFPAIQVEPTESGETPYTLNGMGSAGGENLLTMTFRVFGFDIALGQPGTLAQNLAQFSDRIQAVFRSNPTLDGFCRDVRIPRVVFGRLRGGPRSTNPIFAPHPILATQLEVVVEKEISRQ